MDPTTPATAADSAASLYALIGVIGAAVVTAIGAVLTTVLSRKKEKSGVALDAAPSDITFMTKAYQDCRKDLEAEQAKISKLEWELDEARELNDFFMRELHKKAADG